ncbi:Hsp20/alpha crystallin family protein [Nanoarchaeota archaeon]|nr:MAG: Hsp20/alpha crystallin family protein [Nanoarchaeota archaeon]
MVVFDPFEELRRMEERLRKIERMFEQMFPRIPEIEVRFPEGFREPLSDLRETEDSYILSMEIPGVKKDEISIHATEDEIEVKAESKKLVEEEKEGIIRKERSYRGFYRKFKLPSKIDPENIEAKYEDGVLEIKMPKKEKEKKKVKVKIK